MQQKINEKSILIISIFVAGLCSIIYELLVSTTSSYFLGDSVKQFSITIGVYMAAMGLGSFISRVMKTNLLWRFIEVEILLGLIGGMSVPILYFIFATTGYSTFSGFMILIISIIGMLTGLEIPLLARIMEEYYPLDINLSNVLSFDYLGALIATLLFPFILLPFLGVFQSSLLFGVVNVGIGFLNIWYFREHLTPSKRRLYGGLGALITVAFITMFAYSGKILEQWDQALFRDRIIFTKNTPYQTIVLTKGNGDLRLYLNRVIQFSSTDEYRYHETIAHVPLAAAPYKKRVLILGGGEGLAAREVLKHEEVEEIKIVDIDPEIFRISRENADIRALNEAALDHPKVETIPVDAFAYLQQSADLFDVIIADLPDPTTESLARLYSREFFRLAKKRLTPYGVIVTQASSPFHTKNAYWCIDTTMQSAGFVHTYPYHIYVPAFGEWGFIMASDRVLNIKDLSVEVATKFLDEKTLQKSFHFEKDMLPGELEPNTLDRPILLDYYLEDWRRWSRETVKQ